MDRESIVETIRRGPCDAVLHNPRPCTGPLLAYARYDMMNRLGTSAMTTSRYVHEDFDDEIKIEKYLMDDATATRQAGEHRGRIV